MAEEALVSVGTPALLQEMRTHLSFELWVATGPTELVPTMCKLAEHARVAVTGAVEVGASLGLVPDIAADQLVQGRNILESCSVVL